VESVSELVVVGRVVSKRVLLPLSSVVGEGEPVGDVVAAPLDVLGAEALARLGNEEGHFPGDELYGCIIGRVSRESRGPEEPSNSRGVVTQAEDALASDGFFLALLNNDPNGDGHRKEFEDVVCLGNSVKAGCRRYLDPPGSSRPREAPESVRAGIGETQSRWGSESEEVHGYSFSCR
jgi:hypothetical protein